MRPQCGLRSPRPQAFEHFGGRARHPQSALTLASPNSLYQVRAAATKPSCCSLPPAALSALSPHVCPNRRKAKRSTQGVISLLRLRLVRDAYGQGALPGFVRRRIALRCNPRRAQATRRNSPRYSPELRRIVSSCLRKNLQQRCPSSSALLRRVRIVANCYSLRPARFSLLNASSTN